VCRVIPVRECLAIVLSTKAGSSGDALQETRDRNVCCITEAVGVLKLLPDDVWGNVAGAHNLFIRLFRPSTAFSTIVRCARPASVPVCALGWKALRPHTS